VMWEALQDIAPAGAHGPRSRHPDRRRTHSLQPDGGDSRLYRRVLPFSRARGGVADAATPLPDLKSDRRLCGFRKKRPQFLGRHIAGPERVADTPRQDQRDAAVTDLLVLAHMREQAAGIAPREPDRGKLG